VLENEVFISTLVGIEKCCLLNIKDEKPVLLWQNKNMRNHFSTCVYVDGYLYGCDGKASPDTSLRCIDWNTGDLMWKQNMKMASLIAADGKLMILEEDGTLRIADARPNSYNEISSCDVLEGKRTTRKFYTPPVLYRGKIYCRNWTGALICIDVSK
jgi:outer membrane protein assembly factor BamB